MTSHQVATTLEATARVTAPMTTRGWLIASITSVVLMCTGCSNDAGIALNEDQELSAKLTQLRQTGGSANLTDWTGADWDTVYISHHPVSRDYVEREAGGKIDMHDTFMQRGNILVFLDRGAVVRATYVTPDLLEPGRYSSRVRITAAGYPELIRMSE